VLFTNLGEEPMTVEMNDTLFLGNEARLSAGGIQFATNGEEGVVFRARVFFVFCLSLLVPCIILW